MADSDGRFRWLIPMAEVEADRVKGEGMKAESVQAESVKAEGMKARKRESREPITKYRPNILPIRSNEFEYRPSEANSLLPNFGFIQVG